MPNLLLAALATLAVHLGTMALAGSALGVHLHWVTFGWGPQLLRVSRLRVGVLPVGGAVRFLHSVDDDVPEAEWHQALDRRSTAERLLVTLSGCAVLFALAIALQGRAAVEAFVALPGQLVAGTVSPFGEAQTLLRQIAAAAQSSSFPALLALVMAKCAALNLLPLPMLNGGAALAVLADRWGLARAWPPAGMRALLLLWVGVTLAWLVALGAYVVSAQV